MAQTPSTMVPLGSMAPSFTLPNVVSGRSYQLRANKGARGTLIMFICNHCPFVKHVNAQLVQLANDYLPKGVEFIAISSNDIESHPEDAPEKMKEVATSWEYPFPYLYDETQEIARAYDAACTPDFFLYDKDLKLVYRGQLDGSRPSNDIPVTGKDIRTALDAMLTGMPVSDLQIPSIGCNIKWKKP